MFIYINHGDNQSFLVNTECPVLVLLSYVRSKLGLPPDDTIDLCDKLGTPKLLFQVKTVQERGTEFLLARGTHYVCRVEFGAPGTTQERTVWSFTPLLKNPSTALSEALRMHGQHPPRRQPRIPKAMDGRKMTAAEVLPTTALAQGKAAGRGAARAREEQEGTPSKASVAPGGRRQRPR